MKFPQTLLKPLTLLCASGVFVGQVAYGDSITPAAPQAYQPFTIEITVPSYGQGSQMEYLIDYDMDTNTILLGHLNHGPTGVPPVFRTMTVGIQGLPPGTYRVKTAYMPRLATGNYQENETGFAFTVQQSPQTQRAHALFHSGISHYFVTAADDEASILLSQDNWQVVDFGFNVWHPNDPAPAAAQPVCRFYSEAVNSHFYTGDPNECSQLQIEDQGWDYEGIAFRALLPVDGACPAGTTPVWRLYNNRFAEQDSNHRFVASSETYRSMMAEGWSGEGVSFCSPPEA